MTLEEQNQLIIDNLVNMSEIQIQNIIKQFHNYNTLNGAYDYMIELLESHLANRR